MFKYCCGDAARRAAEQAFAADGLFSVSGAGQEFIDLFFAKMIRFETTKNGRIKKVLIVKFVILVDIYKDILGKQWGDHGKVLNFSMIGRCKLIQNYKI